MIHKKGLVHRGLLIFPLIKDLNAADGILMKNEGIKKGFIENGVDVEVLEFTSAGIFNDSNLVYRFHPKRFTRIYQYNVAVWKKLNAYVKQNSYDFIWFRIPIVNAFISNFIKNVKLHSPNCKIIIEYGAYPFLNELSGIKRIYYLLNKGNEKIAHRFADFVITYCGQSDVDNLPNIPINNGIDLHSIVTVKAQKDLSKRINFICVSSLKKWHAYERFIAGMPFYLQLSEAVPIHFNIVGQGPEYEKLVTLTNNLKLQDHVTFHSFKTGKELDEIYKENDVAIGTLGFHRIGITNSSSLKNREYFARGLPVVLSTQDLDMPADLPFVKYLPADEDPVCIEDIVDFAQRVYNTPNLNQVIRTYAEEHVSWKSKIKAVLEYLNGDIIKSDNASKSKVNS